MTNEPMENEPQDAYLPGSDKETLQPFDVREQSTRNGFLKLFGGLGFLLILAIIVSKLFSSGTRDREQTPRILAENEPYKEAPVNPGGAQAQDQDKDIYKIMDGEQTDAIVKTAPISEEPLTRPKPSGPKSSGPKSSEPKSSRPKANIQIKETPPVKPPKATSAPVSVKPKPIATPKPVSTPKTTKATASGSYVVQVASMRSEAEAQAMWNRLKTKMGDALAPEYFADIKRADLGSRGIYYRLRIGGVGGRENAKAVCRALKAKNQDCIITKK